MKRASIVKLLLVLVLYGLAFYQCTGMANMGKVEKNFAPAITALELYRSATGAYPETLDQLVPQYLSEVPQCPEAYRKWSWGYRRYSNGSYSIVCAIGAFFALDRYEYDFERGEWYHWD